MKSANEGLYIVKGERYQFQHGLGKHYLPPFITFTTIFLLSSAQSQEPIGTSFLLYEKHLRHGQHKTVPEQSSTLLGSHVTQDALLHPVLTYSELETQIKEVQVH